MQEQIEAPRSRAPRRKRLLINPRFQAVFAGYAIITTLVMVPFFVAAIFFFFNLFSVKAHALGLPPESELIQFVDRQQVLLIAMCIGATLMSIVVNLVISYIFSNKIAGTLHRLTSVMNQTESLASARQITPRENDFFKELYAAYNQLVDRSREG